MIIIQHLKKSLGDKVNKFSKRIKPVCFYAINKFILS